MIAHGRKLRNKFLKSALSNYEIGDWSLDVKTINYLEEQIKKVRPKTILEFGSGISTVCLSRFMFEMWNSNKNMVISLEEDQKFAENTNNLVREIFGEKIAKIFIAPLRKYEYLGVEFLCYSLSKEVEITLKENPPDMIIIDGPVGKPEVKGRFGTIIIAKEFVKDEAIFFMDDAFRIDELKTAVEWKKFPFVKIDGIIFSPKGLLIGKIINRK